jgi:uncharacterized protein with PIN domain
VNNKKPIFVVDAMLGKLGKKLRLLGYDTVYSSDIEDDELIRLAKDENRIIISKDVQLVNKATKQQIETVQITESEEIEQFHQINEKVKLGKFIIEGSESRCPLCNGFLVKIEKKLVQGQIPNGVLENTDEFWKCEKCKKIYWEGTHIRNLQKFTEKLNDRL